MRNSKYFYLTIIVVLSILASAFLVADTASGNDQLSQLVKDYNNGKASLEDVLCAQAKIHEAQQEAKLVYQRQDYLLTEDSDIPEGYYEDYLPHSAINDLHPWNIYSCSGTSSIEVPNINVTGDCSNLIGRGAYDWETIGIIGGCFTGGDWGFVQRNIAYPTSNFDEYGNKYLTLENHPWFEWTYVNLIINKDNYQYALDAAWNSVDIANKPVRKPTVHFNTICGFQAAGCATSERINIVGDTIRYKSFLHEIAHSLTGSYTDYRNTFISYSIASHSASDMFRCVTTFLYVTFLKFSGEAHACGKQTQYGDYVNIISIYLRCSRELPYTLSTECWYITFGRDCRMPSDRIASSNIEPCGQSDHDH